MRHRKPANHAHPRTVGSAGGPRSIGDHDGGLAENRPRRRIPLLEAGNAHSRQEGGAGMSEITVTVSQRTWIEAAVEVDVDEIIRTASEKDLRTLVTEAANKGVLSPDGRYGD